MPGLENTSEKPASEPRIRCDIANQALQIIREAYGLEGTLERLSGEKDANFRLRRLNDDPLLVKVINPEEDPAFVNMHTLALLHVEATDPGLPVQRVIRTLDGAPELTVDFAGGTRRQIRVVTYVPGTLQRNAPQSSQQRCNAGRMLARLQMALRDYAHPADNHVLTWDMQHLLRLVPCIDEIEGPDSRAMLRNAFDTFDRQVLSQLDRFPRQVVHNDLNSDNIVVKPDDPNTVAGIIDFGDMVRTARLFDVAIGAAYQMTEAEDLYGVACDFIVGVNSIFPLNPEEVSALVPAIVARMAQRIVITEWRAIRFPDNREYILRNTPQAWRQMHRLAQIPQAEADDRIFAALQQQKDPV